MGKYPKKPRRPRRRGGGALKAPADLLSQLVGLDRDEIMLMEGTEVDEVSAVDEPATGRPFRFFKRAKQDFPGLGTDAPGRPGGNSSLVDLARFLERNPTMTPAAAEAADAGRTELTTALEDDYGGAGDDATVSDPPTAPDFNSAKARVLQRLAGRGIKGPQVEACVQSILEDPDFTAGEFDSAESRAFAICTEQFGDKGGTAMGRRRKQDEEIVVEEMPEATEVVEVPASPTEWPLVQCVADAQELGLNEDNSIQVCQMIRQELGDPENPESILLPDAMDPAALITAAGIRMGVIQPEGNNPGGGDESMEERMARAPIKFTGRNRWVQKLKGYLGMEQTPSVESRRMNRLEKEVGELNKANRDLMEIIRNQNQMIARALGVELQPMTRDSEEDDTAGAGMAADAAAAATAGEEASATPPAPDKRRAKGDDPPATTAVETPAADAETEEGDELSDDERAELEQLRARVAELEGSAAAEGADLGPEAAGELEAASSQPPATSPLPTGVDPAKRGKIIRPIQRKRTSRAPATAGTKATAGGHMVRSSILGGAMICEEDRKALGW